MTTYSYKPATGLEGASTVVPLKTGEFLEVRRGEKTWWKPTETRQKWPSLEAWKATLPAGATVVEKSRRGIAGPLVAAAGWSADFKAAHDLVKSVTVFAPIQASVYIENNTMNAEKLLKKKHQYEQLASALGAAYTPHAIRLGERAATILTAVPYERRLCRKYKFRYYAAALKAQRISDGEFVPIFFDTRRGVLHTPTLDTEGRLVAKEGTTFAELGVRPVFLVPTRSATPSLRMVSLEGVAGAATATAVATEIA